MRQHGLPHLLSIGLFSGIKITIAAVGLAIFYFPSDGEDRPVEKHGAPDYCVFSGKLSIKFDVVRGITNAGFLLNSDLFYKNDQEGVIKKLNPNRKNDPVVEDARDREAGEIRFKDSMYFNITLAALVIIIILFFIMIIRHNKIKAKQQMIYIEQRLLRTQMNPHFIFNSLTNIQDFIFKNEPLKASKYLTNFSNLVRSILESSREEYIPLETELGTIENYLELQKLRHEDKFDYRIEVDETIDPSAVMIPPMLGQPFIENAIEHGLRHKGSRGLVTLRIKIKGDTLQVEIEDNGIGRKRSAEIMKNADTVHRSRATEITIERLRSINRKKKRKSALIISDLKDDSGDPAGTLVSYEVYLKNQPRPQSNLGGKRI